MRPPSSSFKIEVHEHGVAIFGAVPLQAFETLLKLVRKLDRRATHLLTFSGVTDDEGTPASFVFGNPKSSEAWRKEIDARAEARHLGPSGASLGWTVPADRRESSRSAAWWASSNVGVSSAYLVARWQNLRPGDARMLNNWNMFNCIDDNQFTPSDRDDFDRCVYAMKYLGFTINDVKFDPDTVWSRLQAAWSEIDEAADAGKKIREIKYAGEQ